MSRGRFLCMSPKHETVALCLSSRPGVVANGVLGSRLCGRRQLVNEKTDLSRSDWCLQRKGCCSFPQSGNLTSHSPNTRNVEGPKRDGKRVTHTSQNFQNEVQTPTRGRGDSHRSMDRNTGLRQCSWWAVLPAVVANPPSRLIVNRAGF